MAFHVFLFLLVFFLLLCLARFGIFICPIIPLPIQEQGPCPPQFNVSGTATHPT
jgi:hypothetical protein